DRPHTRSPSAPEGRHKVPHAAPSGLICGGYGGNPGADAPGYIMSPLRGSRPPCCHDEASVRDRTMRNRMVIIAVLALWPSSFLLAAERGATPEQVRTAVTKSLALLDKSANEYTRQRECFSCHHQALPLLALTTAKAHGFDVSAATLEKQVAHT